MGYVYTQVCLGQECFSSLIVIPITYRYEEDTRWTNTIKHVAVYINAVPSPKGPGTTEPLCTPRSGPQDRCFSSRLLMELVQEETSAGKEHQVWLNWLSLCHQRRGAAGGNGWAKYFTCGYESLFSCHITRKTKHKHFLNNEPVISTDFSQPTSRLLSSRSWNFARSLEFSFCHFLSLKKKRE